MIPAVLIVSLPLASAPIRGTGETVRTRFAAVTLPAGRRIGGALARAALTPPRAIPARLEFCP
ncbi:MAG TPA: hypothetical protein VGF57_02960, partial [Roseiarcus sp.]